MIPIIPVPGDAETSTRQARRLHTEGGIALDALPPLSLYVHFPWCVKKCPYCDFNSHEQDGGVASIPEHAYLDALNCDLEAVLPLIWGRRVHSVFVGGGTPSLLSAQGLDRLLADVRARVNLEADAEITLEANPGTVESARFESYRKSGVNRLSLGVQSLSDERLHALGRIHNATEARNAMRIARDVFENINLDMMFSLPGQSIDSAIDDLAELLAYAPDHVSLYHLSIEPNTVFAKYPPLLPDDDTAALMQERLFAQLGQGGFERYEISAFARPGMRAKHNLNYWHFGDYLGIGPGAHSKLSFAHRIVRQVRVKQPAGYLERASVRQPLFEQHEVAAIDLPFEFFLNALRLIEGVPVAQFVQRTGQSLDTITAIVQKAQRRQLMVKEPGRLKATELGLRFLNDLQEMFIPAPDAGAGST